MFFQMDSSGDKGNGIKSFAQVCADLGINPVPTITEQTQSGYCFEFHLGMHGTPVVYVNMANKNRRIKKDVPSIIFGSATWQRGEDKFSSRDASDALATVSANAAVFQQIFDSWNAVDVSVDVQSEIVGKLDILAAAPPSSVKILPMDLEAPQPNPFNIQASKEYVFNETGNIMLAKTIDDSSEIEKPTRELFAEVAVFFAAMTRAISTTINPKTKKYYTLYDYEALQAVIDGSGLFVHVTEEDITHKASSWGVSFSKDLIEALLGLATGAGELGFAKAMIASMGSHGLKIGAQNSKSDGVVGNIVFVCEYLMGMPIISAIVVYIDSKKERHSFTVGPCVKESSQSVTLKMHKDTYMFVSPKFIKKYSGDLLSVESDLEYLEFVDYLQDLVERKPVITAVETPKGVPAPDKLELNQSYAITGAFLDQSDAGASLVVKFIDAPATATVKLDINEVQSNVIFFTVKPKTGATGTLDMACAIGLYKDASATEAFIASPSAYTAG